MVVGYTNNSLSHTKTHSPFMQSISRHIFVNSERLTDTMHFATAADTTVPWKK